MRPSSAVVDISDGEIDWPILGVSCSDRNCRLIAIQDNGDKHGPMCCSIFSDDVLQIWMSLDQNTNDDKTCRMPPCPIPRHEVVVSVVTICIVFLVWRRIECILEVGV